MIASLKHSRLLIPRRASRGFLFVCSAATLRRFASESENVAVNSVQYRLDRRMLNFAVIRDGVNLFSDLR